MRQKPRSDSRLKLLPDDRQEQIIEWCETPKSETCVGGLQFAREQLAADGVKVSVTTLSDFYSWYQLRRGYELAAEHAEQQKALMVEFDPSATDRAEAFGDFVFLQEALKLKDPKAFVALGNLRENRKSRQLRERIDSRKLDLAERRVVLLEQRMAEAKAKLTAAMQANHKGGLTPETLRQIEEAAALL